MERTLSVHVFHPEQEYVTESATFRKWLSEQGCRFDRHEHEQRHE
jgi:hypothetical protein